MPKLRRKGAHSAKIEALSREHFSFKKTAYHGFPGGASAVAYEQSRKLLFIGTKTGELRVYGRPGVVFSHQTESKAAITHIFTLQDIHQALTIDTDNTVVQWELVSEGASPSLEVKNSFTLDPDGGKTITAGCLSQVLGHFYLGTQGGNVFILDLRSFQLDSEIIYWNTATAIIQPTAKNNLGAVKCLTLCPSDTNKLLIGYEKGVISLWDLEKGAPFKNYPQSVHECQQVEPLESLSWQYEGLKFVSSHSDSSLYYWSASSSTADEGPILHYAKGPGESACQPIKKISWLNTDASPLIIFSGGLPCDQDEGEHHTVTVIQGTDHIALDFTSPIVEYVTSTDRSTRRGKVLIVLCEQELLAFDLEAPKCPQIHKPYLFSLHASPVTCMKLFEGCSDEFVSSLKEAQASSPLTQEHFSQMEWPAMGGYIRSINPTSFDIFVTGHEDGSIKFWDVTSGSMSLIYQLRTANLFVGQEPDMADDFADFRWPPYKRVSSYDPFEDDPRLAVKFVEMCQFSRTLCVGGNGGQVLTFSLNLLPSDIKLECCKADILVRQEPPRRGAALRNTSPLECKVGEMVPLPAGFQASFCLQLMPASTATAMAYEPSWGVVAAANSKGFAVANFLLKRLVLIHPTVLSDGIHTRSIGRVHSIRRSMRRSFRRHSTSLATSRGDASHDDDRSKIAHSLNREVGVREKPTSKRHKGHRSRMNSEPASNLDRSAPSPSSPPPPPSGGEQVSPEMMGVVTHLVFAETHPSGGGSSASVFASTMGSVVIRYSLSVPSPKDRLVEINRAFLAGKDYTLLHAAPVVAVFVLDHSGVPIPSPYEVEHRVVPPPDMHTPHFALICTQEQVKLISLPGMRQKRKEKVSEIMHERIMKAWVMRVKVAAAPVGAARDWNPALAILTNGGNLTAFSLPDLRVLFNYDNFIESSDHKGLHSTIISMNGEIFNLRSFSELERSLISSYGFSYHTMMFPSLFPFEGSTSPAHMASSSSQQVEVSVEVREDEEDEEDERSRRSQTPSPEHRRPSKKKKGGSRSRRRSNEGSSRGKGSQHSGSKEPSFSPAPEIDAAKNDVDGVNGVVREEEKVEMKEKQKCSGASGYDVPSYPIIASALPGLRLATVSSSSSESSSSSSDDDSDDMPMPDVPMPDLPGGDAVAFENPLAVDIGGKELDNIIATSLKQLENARAFYENMQARVKKNE